jgi:hypothetical protein
MQIHLNGGDISLETPLIFYRLYLPIVVGFREHAQQQINPFQQSIITYARIPRNGDKDNWNLCPPQVLQAVIIPHNLVKGVPSFSNS